MALADKLIVVGIDGMDSRFAKYLMDEGEMPALKELVDRGGCEKNLMMLGGMPTITPPMWTTLSTGAYASTHGITGFWNVDPDDRSKLVYALDSTKCKAEQVWNCLVEDGKKVLVWHWPGSSWPPTTDNPNLAVVDGVQPGYISFGTGMRDTESIVTASSKIEHTEYLPKGAHANTGAGCILEDVAIKNESAGASAADDACANAGAAVENILLSLEDGEFSVELIPYNAAKSSLKEPTGWKAAPEGAKEFTAVISNGFLRRPCLLLKTGEGEYNEIAMYKSKKDDSPMFVVKYHEFTPFINDEVVAGDGTRTVCTRNYSYVYHDDDYSTISLFVSNAIDIEDDSIWHPKALHKEVLEHVGCFTTGCGIGGINTYFTKHLMLPGWERYNDWQADCLNYFAKNEKFDVIFSHLHNVDGLGHNIWPHGNKNNHTNPDDIETNQEFMKEVYRQTDRYIAKFLHLLDEGWTIIVTSDHGLICDTNPEGPALMGDAFGVNAKIMDELGYTVLKRDEEGNVIKEIDWEKTRAVAPGTSHIFLNIEGRDPHGIVDPADKYDLEEEIIDALYNYRDPSSGRRIISLALRNEDALVLGCGQEGFGDIVYFLEDGFHRVHGDSLTTKRDHGDHHTSVTPIFVAAGKGIKQGCLTDRVIREVDVAPTIATLMDTRMPAQCEGAPVYQILDK